MGRGDVLAAGLDGHLPQSPVTKGPRRLLEGWALAARAADTQLLGLDPAAKSGRSEPAREL